MSTEPAIYFNIVALLHPKDERDISLGNFKLSEETKRGPNLNLASRRYYDIGTIKIFFRSIC